MNDLDLRLDQEKPELEVLPEEYSAGNVSSAATVGSGSCPAMTWGTASTLSSK
ncbi:MULTISPECIES: thiocillin family RiPP [unclassified Streptomyces]|uniref:thiocillin family RiPP n=1 Tax=unclassified Streptomyces TaxID=2593676 RepID=UPI000F44C39F|nr:thiocillin family RiPP [Streptomyces sp. I6]RNL71343.1 thiocillin family RiPP [Streptomyces sp. I6]